MSILACFYGFILFVLGFSLLSEFEESGPNEDKKATTNGVHLLQLNEASYVIFEVHCFMYIVYIM